MNLKALSCCKMRSGTRNQVNRHCHTFKRHDSLQPNTFHATVSKNPLSLAICGRDEEGLLGNVIRSVLWTLTIEESSQTNQCSMTWAIIPNQMSLNSKSLCSIFGILVPPFWTRIIIQNSQSDMIPHCCLKWAGIYPSSLTLCLLRPTDPTVEY